MVNRFKRTDLVLARNKISGLTALIPAHIVDADPNQERTDKDKPRVIPEPGRVKAADKAGDK